jgi:hypothetical protein
VEYGGSFVVVHPGAYVDVSWALGETSPTVGYR